MMDDKAVLILSAAQTAGTAHRKLGSKLAVRLPFYVPPVPLVRASTLGRVLYPDKSPTLPLKKFPERVVTVRRTSLYVRCAVTP